MNIRLTMPAVIISFLLGCSNSNNLQDSPPAGYNKMVELNSSIVYLAKNGPIYYQGKKDLIQLKVITSFKKEDSVVGVKFRSIKSTNVYDCRKKNKYMEIPDGFFSDKYAVGSPAVEYPKTTNAWIISKDQGLNGFLWTLICQNRIVD